MLIAWLDALARAHPMGSTFAAQATVLTVLPDRVEVTFTAEVPDDLIRPRPASPDPLEAMDTELAAGLVLQVDDAVVPLARRPGPAPRPGDRGTTQFGQLFEAPLPRGARQIRVSTTNLLDARNVYAADVRLDPRFVVGDCSLWTWRAGRVVRDDTLRWKREEEARSVEVVLEDRMPGPVAWLLGRAGEPVRPASLRPRPGLARFAPPAMGTWGLAAATVGAAVLGRLGAGGRPAVAVALLALGPAAAALPGSGPQEVAVGSLALVLALAGRGPWAAILAAAGLSATTHAWRAALVVALAAGAGLASGAGSSRAARFLAALVGLALVARGALSWLPG